ncbi:MAG: NusG domain II-containing protein [Candidatus Cloacimonadota bacterium]|nr:NusG domain II-containing protein [Candidatus Cloacimonadota bacterium]
MPKKFLKRLTKADIGLVITLVLLTIGSSVSFLKKNTNNFDYAECRIDGKLVKKIDLHKNCEVNLNNGMILEVNDNRIRVIKSDCKKQICIKQGWIKTTNDIIVCVPNRTIIYLKNSKNKNSDLDYISK